MLGDIVCWDVWDWDVRDVGCSECGMFGMWNVRDVECSGCGMFSGMWDVDLQSAINKKLQIT